MKLLDAINNRRTIRKYKDKSVEQEKIDKILEAAIQAPSAGNLQAWEFVVVREKEQKEKLASASFGQEFVAEAPVVIVVCANEKRSSSKYGDRGRNLYCIQDCALATENMLLTAHTLGLGVGFVGAFDEKKIADILELPDQIRPVSIHPVGYPNEETTETSRLSLQKVLHEETF